MQYQEFVDSLAGSQCPTDLNAYLKALWHDARGDWDKAHNIVQNLDDSTAARIHAYLHREEGDEWNSRYWHRRAGSEFPAGISLEAEWEMLVRGLL